jgi:Transglutaminase-like superfamily
MWKAFQRYRALDPEAQRLFWQAVRLLAWIGASLRLRGFQQTKDRLRKKLPLQTVERQETADTLQKTCRMVKAAAHYGPGNPTCLEQSLALWFLLQRQSIPAQLRIGVRKQPEKFEAHAWVECDGVALNQGEEVHRHYAAFEAEFSELPGENV